MTTGPTWAVEPAPCAAWTQWLRKANISLSLTEVKVFSSFLSPWQQQPEHAGSRCGYLIGPDEGLHGQMVLHQLLHVGLSSHQRGELRSSRQSQRRLVGGARRSTGVGVPEEHVPGLAGREEARRKRRRGETGERVRLEKHSFWPRSHWFQESSVRRWSHGNGQGSSGDRDQPASVPHLAEDSNLYLSHS